MVNPSSRTVRVAVNGYGVIGKRVADAVAAQDDVVLAGVSDIETDWRPRMATRKGYKLFGATAEHAGTMQKAGAQVTGTLDDLLDASDLVVDCTPKRVAAKNIEVYRARASSSSSRAVRSTRRSDIRSWRKRTTRALSAVTRRESCRATPRLSFAP
jgi:glyceraldehyde-3-phosphate dehydrogenase type II